MRIQEAMNEYIVLYKTVNGTQNRDVVYAETPKAAADDTLDTFPGCVILGVAQIVADWT